MIEVFCVNDDCKFYEDDRCTLRKVHIDWHGECDDFEDNSDEVEE